MEVRERADDWVHLGFEAAISSEESDAAPVECVICLEDLSDERPVCMLLLEAKRSCRHFMHHVCCEELRQGGHTSCPKCRARFDGTRLLPAMSSVEEWYQAVNDGLPLTKERLLDALSATFRLGRGELATILRAVNWDWSHPMSVTDFSEVIAPWLGAVPDSRHPESFSSAFDQLKAMFPHCSAEQVRAALTASGENADVAAEALLQQEASPAPLQVVVIDDEPQEGSVARPRLELSAERQGGQVRLQLSGRVSPQTLLEVVRPDPAGPWQLQEPHFNGNRHPLQRIEVARSADGAHSAAGTVAWIREALRGKPFELYANSELAEELLKREDECLIQRESPKRRQPNDAFLANLESKRQRLTVVD